jgi:hypothetical protein
LWAEGIDAKVRIKPSEQEFLDVINDRKKASQILVELAKSVKKEALILLPNDKALMRMDRLGLIDYLTKESKNGAIIKIICPLSERNSELVKRLSQDAPDIKILNGNNSIIGMFIADGAKFIRGELSDPDAENFSDAIGFTIYSNSKLSVQSFKLVFELLWEEHVLNDELKSIYSVGVQPNLSEDDAKQYLDEVMKELDKHHSSK